MKINWQATLMTITLVASGMAAGSILADAHGAPAAAVQSAPDCRDGAQWSQSFPASDSTAAYNVTWTCTAGKILPTVVQPSSAPAPAPAAVPAPVKPKPGRQIACAQAVPTGAVASSCLPVR
jgi:hypothetical protein